MTGKCYYLTTLDDWRRHAARFANSHWLVLAPAAEEVSPSAHAANANAAPDNAASNSVHAASVIAAHEPGAPDSVHAAMEIAPHADAVPDDATRIIALIEADEGAHLALEDDPAFEPLPHPLAQKPLSEAAQAALSPHGVAPGATTFDAAEAAARIHPLLRHRVF